MSNIELMSYIRALYRLAGLGMIGILALPLQIAIAGPVFKDYNTLPRIVARAVTNLLGMDVRFRKNPENPPRTKPALFVSNHISGLDPFVMFSFKSAVSVGKYEVRSLPVIGWGARAIHSIFVRRNNGGLDIPHIHGQLAQALNAGRNILVFPQGGVRPPGHDGPLKKGVLSILFSNLSDVPLTQEVTVVPHILRLTHVNGKAADSNPSLSDQFYWSDDRNVLRYIWDVLCLKSARLEVTELQAMNPKDYPDFTIFAEATREILKQGYARGPDFV